MKKTLLLLIFITLHIIGNGQASGYYFQDTIYFDSYSISSFSIDSIENTKWQIGNPSKNIFTHSLNGQSSIVIDTVNGYLPNSTTSFTVDIEKYLTGDTGYVAGIYDVSFRYSINTDDNAGGYILISGDSINWYNIFDQQIIWDSLNIDMNPYSYAFGGSCCPAPDTLFNGEAGFEGNSINQYFSFAFGLWPLKSNNFPFDFRPFVKFIFTSDSTAVPMDGWMIDDLAMGIAWTSSIHENLSKSITLYPNPTTDKLAFSFDENKFKPTELAITNVLGQQVLKTRFQKTVDVSTMQQGVYYVTVTDSKGNSAAKMFYKQ